MNRILILVVATTLLVITAALKAQDKSVRPGINDPFQNPDVKKFESTFEGESREVFAKRKEIVAAVELKAGLTIADVGAGTGLFTRMFAAEVGPKGKVFAVDIADQFLKHIDKINQESRINNVKTILCKPDSAELPPGSVDVAFICDAYHHFEFPYRTMSSIHMALKPGGRVVLIDFRRVKGQSTEWVMNHVRAGQEVFEREIAEVGFKKVKEVKDVLKDNYLVVFEKVEKTKTIYPVIADYGGVVKLPLSEDQPRAGMKVVFDVTAVAKDAAKPLPAFERAATLLNLAGASGFKSTDLEIAIVLHGDATFAAMNDEAYRNRFGRANESAVLMQRLSHVGVKIMVCGQALARKDVPVSSLRSDVTVAAAALTAVYNRQKSGFVCFPSH